jgi:hypothetical protein
MVLQELENHKKVASIFFARKKKVQNQVETLTHEMAEKTRDIAEKQTLMFRMDQRMEEMERIMEEQGQRLQGMGVQLRDQGVQLQEHDEEFKRIRRSRWALMIRQVVSTFEGRYLPSIVRSTSLENVCLINAHERLVANKLIAGTKTWWP